VTVRDDAPGSAALVSIALCTYNGSRFLAQQLDSLLAQTHPRLEIVVVDDASTDDTVAILENYARRDPRIQVSVNEVNVGFAQNFDRALACCRGVFIAPCDQDDIWLPEKVSALVAAIDGRALAYCDSTLVDEQGQPTGQRMSHIVPMHSTDDPVAFAFGNCVSGHAMLFRRELMALARPVPAEFFYDWWIAAVAASAGGIVYVAQSLVLYRQHGTNVTDARLGEMMQEAGIDSQRSPGAATKRRSSSDDKLRFLREAHRRIGALAQLPGRHQSFIAELHRLWSARETQWLSLSLGWFMLSHRRRLLALTKLSEKKQKRYCRRFFRGLLPRSPGKD